MTALMPGRRRPTSSGAPAWNQSTRLGQMRKDDPAEVAHDGVRALLAGDDKVVAGSVLNKAQALFGKFAGRLASLRTIHAFLSKPGSGNRAGDGGPPRPTRQLHSLSTRRPTKPRTSRRTGPLLTRRAMRRPAMDQAPDYGTPAESQGDAGYGTLPSEGRLNAE